MRRICASARCARPAWLVFSALVGAGCFSPTGSGGGTSGTDSDATSTGVVASTGVAASTGEPTSTSEPTTSTGGTTIGDTTGGGTTAVMTTTGGTTGETTVVGSTGPAPECGNGVIDVGEECDDGAGNGNNKPCTAKCKLNVCGDGFPCADCGDQECDDGNINDGDGCSPECAWEHRVVFVTNGAWAGKDLGGLVGADAKCNNAAGAVDALQGRKFRAWLSKNDEEAVTRIGAGDVPYRRTDGVVIADNAAGLSSGQLKDVIDRTETQTMVGTAGMCDAVNNKNDNPVWTGTELDGTAALENCQSWSMLGVLGRAGNASQSGSQWTDCANLGCGTVARLYCVQVVL